MSQENINDVTGFEAVAAELDNAANVIDPTGFEAVAAELTPTTTEKKHVVSKMTPDQRVRYSQLEQANRIARTTDALQQVIARLDDEQGILHKCSTSIGTLDPRKLFAAVLPQLPDGWQTAIDSTSEKTVEEQVAAIAMGIVREAVSQQSIRLMNDSGIHPDEQDRYVKKVYKETAASQLQGAIPLKVEKAAKAERMTRIDGILERALRRKGLLK